MHLHSFAIKPALIWVALGLSACGTSTMLLAPAPSAGDTGYTVAEWGVVVYQTGGALELVSGPPAPRRPGRYQPPQGLIEKPVIYVRPDTAWDLRTEITATVTMTAAGRLHEVWPTPQNGRQPREKKSFSWQIKEIHRSSCAPGWGPKSFDPPCRSLPRPDVCEAASFERWVPESAVCLDTGGVPAPALLYNGFPATRTAPIGHNDEAAGVFRNVSGLPLGLILFRHQTTGVVHRVDSLDANAAFDIDGAPPAEVDPAVVVAAELTRRGLNAYEAADFMRAWAPVLQDPKKMIAFGFLEAAAI